MGLIKEPWEIAMMRHSGGRLAEVGALLREAIRPGVSTLALDELAERAMRAKGAVPSFKGYVVGNATYHHSICASLNHRVVHGIPDEVEIVEGDLVSIDIGLIYGGYHADHAFSVVAGAASPVAQRLIDATERAMLLEIGAAVAGNRMGDIGHACQAHVEPLGYGVVTEYVGHGIGRAMHERPSVPNVGKRAQGQLLKQGMCLAIEPMITQGKSDTQVLSDGWTVVTRDGKLSAHFEHTVAIGPKGAEILTRLPD